MHLSHVAELHPLGHRLAKPRRIADLLIEVEVGSGRLAVDDEGTVLLVVLLDVTDVGVGHVCHVRASSY